MTSYFTLSFPSSDPLTDVTEGKNLLQAVQEKGISVRSDCGGKGLCGKCLVKVEPSSALTPLTDTEAELLSPAQIKQGFRLACQSGIKAGLKVQVPPWGAESQEIQGKETLGGFLAVDPEGRVPISVLRNGHEKRLGLAIDLGTTTLAAYLCDLKSGQVLATTASVNPQRRYGEDVISRIGFCQDRPGGLKILQELVIEAVNYLISRCLNKVAASRKEVEALTVAGNTTMGHIFVGLDPSSLGRAPYLPVAQKTPSIRARELGLDLMAGTEVYLLPVISGFVGGDALGVILADKTHLREEMTLVVDIGTNGEVVLGNRQGLLATSCATGPALEGAHISCGMRAVPGAINRVAIDPVNYEPAYEVLGNKASLPLGLCGSGMIDAIAAMRQTGLVLENGRLREGLPGVISDDQGVGRGFRIVPREKSATGEEIVITLLDIRQVQLAKSALGTGIELLMKQRGVTGLDRTVLTGAFGAGFNWRSAIIIGLLPPPVIDSEIISQDNLAGIGAVLTLLDKNKRIEAESLIDRIGFVELAGEPGFAELFTQSTMFPSLDRLPGQLLNASHSDLKSRTKEPESG